MCANTVSSRQEAKVRCQGPLGTARAQPYSLRLLICPARKEFVFFPYNTCKSLIKRTSSVKTYVFDQACSQDG